MEKTLAYGTGIEKIVQAFYEQNNFLTKNELAPYPLTKPTLQSEVGIK
jgi:hypothetical protein